MLLSSENPINPVAICALELPEPQIFYSNSAQGIRPDNGNPVIGYGVVADLTGIQIRNVQLAIDSCVFAATWNQNTGSLHRVMWPLTVLSQTGYLLAQFHRNKIVEADVVQFDRWRLRPSVQGAKNLLVAAMHSLIRTESIHNINHQFMGAEMIVRALSPIPVQLSGQLAERVANFADLHEGRQQS